jgi:hypothetical protein
VKASELRKMSLFELLRLADTIVQQSYEHDTATRRARLAAWREALCDPVSRPTILLEQTVQPPDLDLAS